MNPYGRLAELAEIQVEILAAGRFDDLPSVWQEWDAH